VQLDSAQEEATRPLDTPKNAARYSDKGELLLQPDWATRIAEEADARAKAAQALQQSKEKGNRGR
jgi:hypothetical protein